MGLLPGGDDKSKELCKAKIESIYLTMPVKDSQPLPVSVSRAGRDLDGGYGAGAGFIPKQA